MKKLTSAVTPHMIHHFRNLLEAEGIPCQVRNEHLGSILGEMPFTDTWPELWVINDLDYDRAMQLVKDASAESPSASWRCRKCGETNEGQFAACWNCGESV